MEPQPPQNPSPDLLERAGVLGARRHLFLCIGPECCDPAQGEALWEEVKHRVKQSRIPAMRTKAACLRVCCGGPWLVVYPEGVWYGAVTIERFERILESHLKKGQPVVEWVVACNPLGDGECGVGA
jgi:(2Fe-2S) ferredoxin